MAQSLTVSDISTVKYSGNLSIDSLLDTGANWNYLTPQRNVLNYTFDISAGTESDQPALTAFNATQMASTRAILTYITSITGIQFAETASGSAADFHFSANNIINAAFAGLTDTTYSYSYNGSNIITSYSADAYIYLDNANYASVTASPTAGSAGYELLLHEIGHALGLKHPFEGPYTLPTTQNNTNNTLMSYTHVGANKTAFQSYDLLTLQWLYGEDGLGGASGASNTPPTASNLDAAETYTEDTALNLTDIVVTDSDSSTVTVNLTLSNTAAGSLNTGTSGPVTSSYNTGTGVWSASGAIANVNTLLAALTFTPATNFNGDFTLSTRVSDGIAAAITGSKSFTGEAVNDPAVISGKNSGNVMEDAAPNTVTGTLTATDADNSDNLFLAAAAGSVSTGGYGTYAVTTAGVWTYTLNNSNATVNALNTGSTLTDTFTVKSTDGTAKVITITINGVYENLILLGGPGNNILTGRRGNDQLNGGLGRDTMTGGLGNDTYTVDNTGDVVIETSSLLTEIDTVYSSINYTLGDFVENLILTGTAALGTGNTLNNVLTGNASANTLNGLAGADTMIGGLGNDAYKVDNADDNVIETSSVLTEVDTVNSSIGYTLGDHVENLTLTGNDAINGIGNALNNTLLGNKAANTLMGAAGADKLTGGEGADLLIGGLGRDVYTLTETVSTTDTLRIAAGDSLVSGYDVATGFNLSVDKLDLSSTLIAANIAAANGANSGIIHSHHIVNGLISFDDVNIYQTPFTVASSDLAKVFTYLQANITAPGTGSTVAFNAIGNTYIFQDGGANDTLVQLTGITADGVATSLATTTVWLV